VFVLVKVNRIENVDNRFETMSVVCLCCLFDHVKILFVMKLIKGR